MWSEADIKEGIKKFMEMANNCHRPSIEEMEKNIESCKKPIELEEEVIFYD